jgi:hypothetical protein
VFHVREATHLNGQVDGPSVRVVGSGKIGVQRDRLNLRLGPIAAHDARGDRSWDGLVCGYPRLLYTRKRALPALVVLTG